MGMWTFIAIVAVVAILSGAFNDYQKNKMKLTSNTKFAKDLQDEIKKLERRIENLEIIAVSEPDNFRDRADTRKSVIIDPDPAQENQRLVNEMARKKQGTR